MTDIFASLDAIDAQFACDSVMSNAADEADGLMADASEALRFIHGGSAIFTLASTKTGVRFTYKVSLSEKGDIYFVSVLNGPDNYSNYQYMGVLRIGPSGNTFARTAKSRIGEDAPSHKAFAWAYRHISRGEMPEGLGFYHEGKCARCSRRLTDPESIRRGFGPECFGRL
jgi:hypothetical protein